MANKYKMQIIRNLRYILLIRNVYGCMFITHYRKYQKSQLNCYLEISILKLIDSENGASILKMFV